MLKSSSTWAPSPAPSLAHCEILGNCLGLSELKLLLIMFLIMTSFSGRLSAELCAQVK